MDVIDGAARGLQEVLQGQGRQLPEAARRLASFLDDVVTQAFLDDSTIMGLVGRLVHHALQLPALAQVPTALVCMAEVSEQVGPGASACTH